MEKIVIIGGGVGGLSAGIYALLAGFDVEIYPTTSGFQVAYSIPFDGTKQDETVFIDIEPLKVGNSIMDRMYVKTYGYDDIYIHDGSYMSFTTTPMGKKIKINGRIKGIKNLYLAGQWTNSPGGLPVAASSGKFAIQRILKTKGRDINI